MSAHAMTASCIDPPTPGPIDVAALSQGRPDGIYYAGKRLLPWLTFEERLKLGDYRGPPKELLDLARGESVVVRWEIADGRAGAAAELRRPTLDSRPESPSISFIWSDFAHHVLVYSLGHALLEDALSPARVHGESTNDHIDWFTPTLNTLHDEWVIPAIEIRRRAALEDLRRARKRADAAETAVESLGIRPSCVDRELADHIDRSKA